MSMTTTSLSISPPAMLSFKRALMVAEVCWFIGELCDTSIRSIVLSASSSTSYSRESFPAHWCFVCPQYHWILVSCSLSLHYLPHCDTPPCVVQRFVQGSKTCRRSKSCPLIRQALLLQIANGLSTAQWANPAPQRS